MDGVIASEVQPEEHWDRPFGLLGKEQIAIFDVLRAREVD
jgi:hypothetical protein